MTFQFKFHYDSINSKIAEEAKKQCIEFKFHYDSINSEDKINHTTELDEFKFHYDSINSERCDRLRTRKNNLNSIMILLIPILIFTAFISIRLYLNSIMILLIRITAYYNIYILLHLNSIMILLIHKADKANVKWIITFKFHYDSINS